MNWLLSKLPLVGKIVDAVNGNKTYLGSVGVGLAGAAKVLLAVAAILSQIQAADGAGLVALIRTIQDNPNVADLLLGVGAVSGALSALGLRHAIAKQEAPKP